ncbi:MAG: hypothetical protein ACK55Z_37910, partial [bacterium]
RYPIVKNMYKKSVKILKIKLVILSLLTCCWILSNPCETSPRQVTIQESIRSEAVSVVGIDAKASVSFLQ